MCVVTILVFRFDYSSESYSFKENFSKVERQERSRCGKFVPAAYEKIKRPAPSLGTDHLYT